MAITVGDPIGWGLSRVTVLLFRPYERKKWLAIAVAAWLANVTEWNGLGGLPMLTIEGPLYLAGRFEKVMETISGHMTAVIVWTMVAAVVLGGAYLLLRWLSCRGQFMILAAVAENGISVKESWRRHRELGNNLLKFRIGWDLAIFNVFLIIFVVAGILAWQDVRPMLAGMEYRVTWWTKSAVVVGGVLTIVAGLATLLAMVFLNHLMVPVMFVRQMKAKEAFGHSRELLRREKKACFQYFLVMTLTEGVQGTAMMAASIAVVIVTLGIALVLAEAPLLSLLPAYGAMALALPVEAYVRAYSLYFVGQFGEEYRVAWRVPLPEGDWVRIYKAPRHQEEIIEKSRM
jgi:hypothetical protein